MESSNRQDAGRMASVATPDALRPTEEGVSEANYKDMARNAQLESLLGDKILELEVNSAHGKGKGKTKASKVDKQEILAILNDEAKSNDEKSTAIALLLAQSLDAKASTKDALAMQRSAELATREKERAQSELARVNTVKEKLEALCRELQKQNKIIHEESKRAALDDAEKRKELSTRFQSTVTEINDRLQQQGDERAKQIQENDNLRDKLVEFGEKLEVRETMHSNELKAKSLEVELYLKRLEQEVIINQEAQSKLEAYVSQALFLTKTEAELRSQLATYRDKFEQFQEMITSSHEAFTTFKNDIEMMSKRIKKLEKENLGLREKTAKSDVAMINLLDERTKLDARYKALDNKKQALEGLCRSLQAERKKKDADDEVVDAPKENEPANSN
eukprot:CAMPEP_0198222026 /NCGR_PEP_ID=MMETSP1445-20131203/86294_1 /TAXON_ID=36898 /ORGANISM="Pyramimonas sp., Strain CCMP2087" /LENGTH=390 /DNA_ID=CAMNT_0043900377 /DNA_START=83 /DNA_END=1255 /DNA_ORIENTATION=-